MEMMPVRMNPDMLTSSSRKVVSSPMEKKPTTGQKAISKRLKMLRFVISQFLKTKAHIRINVLCKLKEDILQVCLPHRDLLNLRSVPGQEGNQGTQPPLRFVHHDLALAICDRG